jgi:hypothetical protein
MEIVHLAKYFKNNYKKGRKMPNGKQKRLQSMKQIRGFELECGLTIKDIGVYNSGRPTVANVKMQKAQP